MYWLKDKQEQRKQMEAMHGWFVICEGSCGQGRAIGSGCAGRWISWDKAQLDGGQLCGVDNPADAQRRSTIASHCMFGGPVVVDRELFAGVQVAKGDQPQTSQQGMTGRILLPVEFAIGVATVIDITKGLGRFQLHSIFQVERIVGARGIMSGNLSGYLTDDCRSGIRASREYSEARIRRRDIELIFDAEFINDSKEPAVIHTRAFAKLLPKFSLVTRPDHILPEVVERAEEAGSWKAGDRRGESLGERSREKGRGRKVASRVCQGDLPQVPQSRDSVVFRL